MYLCKSLPSKLAVAPAFPTSSPHRCQTSSGGLTSSCPRTMVSDTSCSLELQL